MADEDKTLKKVSDKLDEGVKKFEKPASKFDSAASDLQNLFRGFDLSSLEKVAQNSMGMQSSLDQFMDARRDSIAGFSDDMNAAYRETLKWADRTKFDIATMAEKNIRTMREGIDQFEPMQTEMGSMLETRMLELSQELMTADLEQAQTIRGEMLAIKKSGEKLGKKEAERLEFIASNMDEGFEQVTGFTNTLKSEIKNALPSLDKFAENILGGGILGKTAGMLIRSRRKSKEAKQAVGGRFERAEQDEAKKEAERYQSKLAEMSGGVDYYGEEVTDSRVEEAQSVESEGVIDQLKELNRNVVSGLGVRSPGYLFDMLNTLKDDASDEKEESGEERRIEERQHDELIAALGGGEGGGGEAEGGDGGGFLGAIAKTGKALGKGIQGLLTGLAKGIGAFGDAKVFKGILAIGLLGLALPLFVLGLSSFSSDVDWKGVGLGSLALIGFAIAAGIVGKFATQIIMGSVAIGALGVALIPFSFALGMFSDIDFASVFIGLGALAAFAVVAGIMSLAAVPILIGTAVIAALGVALIPVAAAFMLFGKAAEFFGQGMMYIGAAISMVVGAIGDFMVNIIDKFIELAGVGGGGLVSAAGGIVAVTAALAAFLALSVAGGVASSVGNVIGSVGDWVSGWFGGEPAASPMDMLGALTSFGEVGEGIGIGAAGIYELMDSLEAFGALQIDSDTMNETIGVVAGLGGAIKAFMGNAPEKMMGIGDLVGGAVGAVTGWFKGLLGIEEEPKINPIQILERIAAVAPQIAIIGPALSKLSAGMVKILAFQNATFPTEFFDQMYEALGSPAIAAMLDKNAESVKNLADSIGDLTGKLTELNAIPDMDISGRLALAQTANVDMARENRQARDLMAMESLGEKGLQMATTMNNNVNNSTVIHQDLHTRDHDASLNSLMSRRR